MKKFAEKADWLNVGTKGPKEKEYQAFYML